MHELRLRGFSSHSKDWPKTMRSTYALKVKKKTTHRWLVVGNKHRIRGIWTKEHALSYGTLRCYGFSVQKRWA